MIEQLQTQAQEQTAQAKESEKQIASLEDQIRKLEQQPLRIQSDLLEIHKQHSQSPASTESGSTKPDTTLQELTGIQTSLQNILVATQEAHNAAQSARRTAGAAGGLIRNIQPTPPGNWHSASPSSTTQQPQGPAMYPPQSQGMTPIPQQQSAPWVAVAVPQQLQGCWVPITTPAQGIAPIQGSMIPPQQSGPCGQRHQCKAHHHSNHKTNSVLI